VARFDFANRKTVGEVEFGKVSGQTIQGDLYEKYFWIHFIVGDFEYGWKCNSR